MIALVCLFAVESDFEFDFVDVLFEFSLFESSAAQFLSFNDLFSLRDNCFALSISL